MIEHSWEHLAVQIANGTAVAEGNRVGIFMTDAQAMPAVEAFVRECYRRGAYPQVIAADERFDRAAVEFAADDVLAEPAPLEAAAMNWADVHVSFRAMVAPPTIEQDEERLAAQRRAKGDISTLRWQNTRWALVRVPTPEWAQLIGASYDELLSEFFAGCLADWPAAQATWDALCRDLEREDTVHILSADTDLRLRTAGRKWISFAGEANLPDGEIATAPVDDGVDGYITFPGTFWFAGARITDLRLEFENGLVTSSSAAEGAGLVERLLDTDGGARRVGELGIGTNPAVRTFTGDLLIDEKILGTVHIALGRAYPACGGVNESSLHWDIVKDLRTPGSSLTAGGLALISDGQPVGPLAH